MRQYWIQVFKRAIKDTLHSLNLREWQTLLRTVTLFAIALVTVWWLGGQGQMTEELRWGISAVIATGAVFFGTFLFNMILAPVRLDKETKTEITKLSNEKRNLYKTITRTQERIIEITYDKHYSYCLEMVAEDKEGLCYIYRVGVRITGNKTVENVEVSIFDLQKWDIKTGESVSLPILGTLRPMDYKTGEPCYLTIHPGYALTNYVDVFTWKPTKGEIEFCYCDHTVSKRLDSDTDYILTLLAKGKNVSQTDYALSLRVDTKHNISNMTLEEIEQWESGEQ